MILFIFCRERRRPVLPVVLIKENCRAIWCKQIKAVMELPQEEKIKRAES